MNYLSAIGAWKPGKRSLASLRWSASAAVFGISIVLTYMLRRDAVEDETNVRLIPALRALDYTSSQTSEPDPIISLEPLIIQMYADTATCVIDLAAVSPMELRTLMLSDRSVHPVLIEETDHQTDADIERYGDQFKYLDSLSRKTLYTANGFEIVRLEVRP
jgi:hypothetical protein